jgi:hypothetical protein
MGSIQRTVPKLILPNFKLNLMNKRVFASNFKFLSGFKQIKPNKS